MRNLLIIIATGLGISAALALALSLFTSAKFLSTAFFIWAAIFLNASVAGWEDAMPGGLENIDGEPPAEFRGHGRVLFWAGTCGGTAAIAAIGIALYNHGL